jgi:hypothetical protein
VRIRTVCIASQALIAAAALALTWPAAAQKLPQRKPGLWEIRSSVDDPAEAQRLRELQARIAQMPPEKRARMEQALAQHSVGTDGKSSSSGIMRVCLTAQDAADEARIGWKLDESPSHPNCKTESFTGSATEFRKRDVCKGSGDVATIDAHAYDISPVAFKMDTTMVTTAGRQRITHLESRWVSADCGAAR